MEQQAKPGQPFLEVDQHPPCIGHALEAHDEVVGVAHDRDPTACMPPSPLVDPEVEDVVQEDVGQERADARPLWRPLVRLVPLVALQDTGLEPHPDQPEHPGVGDPVRQHPQQPLVVDRVEEAADVGIEHPVHALAHDRGVQRCKRLVRVPPRPEAVGEPEEVGLVDGAQHLGDRALDDLVFQRRHAEWTLPAIRFRDVHTPDRVGPVASGMDPGAEVLEIAPQAALVVVHRDPVDSRTRPPLLTPERPFERFDVNVMQQGGKPGLDGPEGRRVHPGELGWKGDPALRPDPALLAWGPSRLAPSLGTSRFLRRCHRYYEPVRRPTSARTTALAMPRRPPPSETNLTDPVGPLMFR